MKVRTVRKPVEITVREAPERWVPRGLLPAGFEATATDAPQSMKGISERAVTADSAVRALLLRFRSAGYSGTARVRSA